MRHLTRTVLLAGIVTCAAGAAWAAEGKDASPAPRHTDGAAPTTSMGAGGLTGTGATRDGARTGTDTTQPGAAKPPSAPAAGTAR